MSVPRSRRSRRLAGGSLVAVLALGLLVGFALPRDDDFFALRKSFQIFGSVYEELVGHYVDDLNPEQVMRAGVDAMLDDLDPYTVFIDEAQNADIDIMARGRYGTVGLSLGLRGGQVTVSAPEENAGGYRQGVRAGDVITHVEGQPTEGLSVRDVHALLRGDPGTAVEVTVAREGEPEPLRFLLTREQPSLHNVSYSGLLDGTEGAVGYVKLERFGRNAGAEVRRAIGELAEGQALDGLVLDLRANPGGLLDEAVEITQLFVPQGSTIVSTRGRNPQTQRVYRSSVAPMYPDLPLVVLVDGFSASASEIVAGAVQDLDRGVVLGTTTFGKGLVQIIKPLPYNTSLKITTSKYYTPSGRCIQAVDYGEHDGTSAAIPDSLRQTFRTQGGRTVRDGRGIEPDRTVSLGEESELEAALRRRAAFFFYANHYAATHPNLPDDFAVDGALMDDFRRWLEQQDFTYRTAAERDLEALAGQLAALDYDDARDELADLQRAVADEKASDFERHAPRLRERLRSEILARYLDRDEQIAATLGSDIQVDAATALLTDASDYSAILR